MVTKELEEYRHFCKPAELDKAINMLRGLLIGISCDSDVSEAEIMELSHWILLHKNMEDRHPFDELIPVVEEVIADNVITEDEKADILWLCSSFIDVGDYYDLVTASIQILHGMVHGIMADGELSDAEIQALRSWLDKNECLRGIYPYDELDSLICAALADGVIEPAEREMLKAFLGTLIEFKDSRNLIEKDFAELREKYSIQGVCAVCPEIEFDGKVFCFTGQSYKATRAEIFEEIEKRGGIARSAVSKNTNYLVVGNAGNPCWAFACYGRKIEEAIKLRKDGAKVIIVNETDFWDALED